MSTYTPIASQTLASAAASITFTNIPQNYTDLILITSTKTTSGAADGAMGCYLNGDTANNYSSTGLYGNGTSALSLRATNQPKLLLGRWSNSQYTTSKTQFQNYSNTTTFKTVLSQGGNTTNYIFEWVNLWRSTSSVASMQIIVDDGANFDVGSTFNLYGIVSGSAKATGGTVTTDGTYFYHTFTSSGVFTPTQALTADYLIVAGGGGGLSPTTGGGGGGGGGAGGYRTSIGGTPLSLTAQAYSVTVGSGGATGYPSSKGSNSVFATITSTGGGRSALAGGGTGGSGGAGYDGSAGGAGNEGGYTPVEGYAGGKSEGNGPSYPGGGGGGSSAAGGNADAVNFQNAGAGGAGTANSISGTSVTYAGGGGGATSYTSIYPGASGGAGGGGTGGRNGVAGTSGTANTGGGGGGGPGQVIASGGNGGSGIVIVRYAV